MDRNHPEGLECNKRESQCGVATSLPEGMTPELILIKKVGEVYIPGGRNSRSEWVSGAMLSSWGPWVCE